ncbi:MAG: phospholipid carrier-dependent glycosyltransferase [Kiritimatiellaeota bacterium]|nr:phospholipid carrier-dependent glycosyltransferase [Kiritimatiellota bacterium]
MRKFLESKILLPGALAFALACRLTVAFIACGDPGSFTDPDSKDYIELADRLAAGDGYTKGVEPEIFRAPGYPFVLSFFRKAFKDNHLPVVLFQAFLSVGSILLLWRLALIVGGGDKMLANLAVLFQSLTLSSIVFSNKILTETFFTFFLTAAILLVETALRNEGKNINTPRDARLKWISVILAGCFAAAALMFRAIVIPIFPLFVVYFFARSFLNRGDAPDTRDIGGRDDEKRLNQAAHTTFRRISRRRTAEAALLTFLFLAPVLLAYGAWSFRNWKTANFAGFSSVGQINIYRYYACLLLAKNNGRTFAEQQGICTAELEAQGAQAKQARYAVEKGLPIIMREPVRYFFLHLKTDVSSLLPDVGDLYRLLGFKIGGSGTLGVIRTKGVLAGVKHYFDGKWGLFLLAVPLVLPLFVKFAAAAVGVITALKSDKRTSLFFFTVLTIYMLVVPGAVSHPRFRVPVEPLISLLAAFGVCWSVRFLKTRDRRLRDKKGVETICE